MRRISTARCHSPARSSRQRRSHFRYPHIRVAAQRTGRRVEHTVADDPQRDISHCTDHLVGGAADASRRAIAADAAGLVRSVIVCGADRRQEHVRAVQSRLYLTLLLGIAALVSFAPARAFSLRWFGGLVVAVLSCLSYTL